MTYYHRLGKIPPKRHSIFRQPGFEPTAKGEAVPIGSIYYEQLVGSKGFDGPASLLYHIRRPTSIIKTKPMHRVVIERDPDETLLMRHFLTHSLDARGSLTLDRKATLFNNDVTLWISQPTKLDPFYYRNADADEVVYVTTGTGTLESQLGSLAIKSGDYVVVPRGLAHRFRFNEPQAQVLIIESPGMIRPPNRYRNEVGQYLEHSPYCERDIRVPTELPVHDETGEFSIVVKQSGFLTEVTLDHHPFDVVGWDGYLYPFALSIHDFEPIVGSLHQPPPVHQTFDSRGFVICSFVPRPFDFHPDAVPAPYAHANTGCDEVLYYANDEFMSRKGISFGSMTLHPAGIPHGPHPGKTEGSIGKERTNEVAVMLDTFTPLFVAKQVLSVEDKTYTDSWK